MSKVEAAMRRLPPSEIGLHGTMPRMNLIYRFGTILGNHSNLVLLHTIDSSDAFELSTHLYPNTSLLDSLLPSVEPPLLLKYSATQPKTVHNQFTRLSQT